jgi:hypothetical protein
VLKAKMADAARHFLALGQNVKCCRYISTIEAFNRSTCTNARSMIENYYKIKDQNACTCNCVVSVVFWPLVGKILKILGLQIFWV